MEFRQDKAVTTLLNVAAALHANWAALTPETQDSLARMIGDAGGAIHEQAPEDRAYSIVRVLQFISDLPDLPQPVMDALAAGSGDPGARAVRVTDRQRDQVLRALCQLHDARVYRDGWALADSLTARIAKTKDRLTPDIRALWEQLASTYQASRAPYETVSYLDALEALLGDRLPFVRKAIEAGKTWERPRMAMAKPPDHDLNEEATGAEDGGGPVTGNGGTPAEGLETTPSPARPQAPVLVQRSANVYFPSTVQLTQANIPLIIQLARAAAQGTVTVTQGSSSLTVAAGEVKLYVHTLDFDIVNIIGGQEIPDVPFGRSVKVDPAADSEPVTFFLTPLPDTAPGTKRISIEFIQSGRRLGSFVFEVGLVGQAPTSAGVTDIVDNSKTFALAMRGSVADGDEAPDLNLRVGLHGKTLSYSLMSADGRYAEKKLGQKVLQGDPKAYFATISAELDQLAALSPEEIDALDPAERQAAETRNVARLQVLGVKLWNEVLSDEFRQAYKDDLRLTYAGKSLVITSDEPWIPWEMVRPLEREAGRALFIDPPLCEQFRLTRWLDGPGAPDQLQVKRGVIVAPVDNLQFVKEELDYFTPLKWTVPIHTLDEVNREFATGTAQLFHFSCHGSAGTTDADEASLKLGDDYLAPSDVLGQDVKLYECMPLVFLNACEAGQAGFTLTGLGGWARTFIELRASIFIGSLWAINDSLAAEFAESFYNRLWGINGQQQQSIGEAFHAARQDIKAKAPGNPTWLAYVLYGDPNGRVYISV